MKTALILTGLLLTVAITAEASHIAGHYGGVPAVQPARPWKQAPVYLPTPSPYRPQRPQVVAPPMRPYYPQTPTLGDPRPYRHTDPSTCRSLLCD
ncbi:MAG: hypothetical protein ACREX3_18700 [Gammaproteobacteria bacterium]